MPSDLDSTDVCTDGSGRRSSPHPGRTASWLTALVLPVALATAAGAAEPGLTCRPIAGAEPLLSAGAIVLLGEIHGTEESPAFLGDLVCTALAAGRSVTVALEVPREEGERIGAFLTSAGAADDRRALLAGPFWQRGYQDGRSSRAMVALLDRLRGWRRAGQPLHVTLLDREERMSGGARDAAMSAQLESAAKAAPTDVVVSLTGNLHNRLVVGNPWDPKFESMGYLLAKALPNRAITSLDVATTGGTIWVCTSPEADSCGSLSQRGKPEGEGGGIVAGDRLDDKGYHGRYAVGAVTASPPAKGDGSPAPGAAP